jgi:hypothetical protein
MLIPGWLAFAHADDSSARWCTNALLARTATDAAAYVETSVGDHRWRTARDEPSAKAQLQRVESMLTERDAQGCARWIVVEGRYWGLPKVGQRRAVDAATFDTLGARDMYKVNAAIADEIDEAVESRSQYDTMEYIRIRSLTLPIPTLTYPLRLWTRDEVIDGLDGWVVIWLAVETKTGLRSVCEAICGPYPPGWDGEAVAACDACEVTLRAAEAAGADANE